MADPLRPLAEALALGEGFQLLLLVVPSEEVADAAVGALVRRLSERGGGLLARLGPSSGADVDVATLEDTVLARLPGPEGAAAVLIDASGATNRDEPAWEELFRRMNARRNGIARALGRPLILALTPRLEGAFAREAPDFWSIRSARVELGNGRGRREEPGAGLGYEAAASAGLVHALTRAFPSPREALPFLAELGFPPARLPLSDDRAFWDRVAREADRGALPGGVETLARALLLRAPGDPAAEALQAALPSGQRVTWKWLADEGPDDYVPPTWAEELERRLDALVPGDTLVLVGEEGAGREAFLRWYAARRPGVCLSLSELAFPTHLAGALSRHLRDADPALAAVLAATERKQPPPKEGAEILSKELRDLLPGDPLGAVDAEQLDEVVSYALRLRVDDTRMFAARWRHDIADWRYSRHVVQLLLSRHAGPSPSFPIPPATPDLLRAILARRLRRADARTRMALDVPATRAHLDTLATLTTLPGVYLRWVKALLAGGPVPAFPSRLTPEGWARALFGADLAGSAERAAALLDDHALPGEDVASAFGVDEARELLDAGVLRKTAQDATAVELTPVAAILRPSVIPPLAAAR